MPENPNTSTPAPATTKRKSPGPIDGKTIARLGKDEKTINALLDELSHDPTLTTDLATHYIDAAATIPLTPTNLTQLSLDAAAARVTAGAATTDTSDFHDITETENTDLILARAAIRSVQARAKEKYEETHPHTLDAYYVGLDLGTRQEITDAGNAIWVKIRTTDQNGNPITPQDTLPGLTAAKIAQYQTDLGSFLAIETEQSGAQKNASQDRETFDAQCEQITRRRRRIQRAIDAERPYGPANNPLRTRLGLPTDRSMT